MSLARVVRRFSSAPGATFREAIGVLRARRLLADTTVDDGDAAAVEAVFGAHGDARGVPAVYAGFDPTAPSLHVGNLVQVMALLRFAQAGFRPIALVGGATAQIGDPSGREDERDGMDAVTLERNVAGIHGQLEGIFARHELNVTVVNNLDWTSGLAVLDFYKHFAGHFRLSSMLGKTSVKTRLDRGMSFTEFSYQIFQGLDFLHLFREHDCRIQVGGSDQFGNITAGTELIRKVTGREAAGVTTSLLVSRTGEKFGKSAGNAVWLDARATSVFDFYQYLLRADDDAVHQLLRSLTFVDAAEIDAPVPGGSAQQLLADAVTTFVHGADGLAKAKATTEVLFGGKSIAQAAGHVDAEDLVRLQDVPRATVAHGDLPMAWPDALVLLGASKSKGEARRLLKDGGVSVNGERLAAGAQNVTREDLFQDRVALVRVGKRRHFLLIAS